MKENIKELIGKLISIDSSNQFLIEGAPGSVGVRSFIKAYLDDHGIENETQIVDEDHSNLKATIKGQGGGRDLSLYAHMDTVGYDLWLDKALKAEFDGDRLIGLGACDDKGHLAIMMVLAKKISEEKPELLGDLHLCFIDDEEGQSCGSFDYVKKNACEACLVLESTQEEYINVCHQGFAWIRIIVGGKAGHGSAGEGSADAISRLAEILVRLERNKRENFSAHPHEMNGETVYHSGYIKGGTDFASYPDSAELGIEIGIQPGETIDDRIREIEAVFKEVREIYPDLDAKTEVVIDRKPFNTEGTEVLCEKVKAAIKKFTGKEAVCIGENAWGDAQIFQDAGFPTLGIGAVGGNLHAPNEWISLSSAEQLVEILFDIVKNYCGELNDE